MDVNSIIMIIIFYGKLFFSKEYLKNHDSSMNEPFQALTMASCAPYTMDPAVFLSVY